MTSNVRKITHQRASRQCREALHDVIPMVRRGEVYGMAIVVLTAEGAHTNWTWDGAPSAPSRMALLGALTILEQNIRENIRDGG